MADKDMNQKDNKDAESGEPVQLDKDQQQGGQQPRPQGQPGQQQGNQPRPENKPDQQQQGGQQDEGGQKR